MLIDARSIPNGTRLDADLCIVGAGPAGLTITRTLAASDIDICLVESGGPELEKDGTVDDLSAGRNVGLDYFNLEDARGRGLGGSGTRWNVPIGELGVGVRLRPLEPIDFEARDWLPRSGWPFDYTYLQPYYHRAAVLCGIEMDQPRADECARRDGHQPLRLNADIAETVMFQLGPASVWSCEDMATWLRKSNIKLVAHGTVTRI